MLTKKEKRFIKYWEEQRKGGQWSYYILYILAGTFVAILLVTFLFSIFLLGVADNLLPIVIISFVVVTAATIFTWQMNERKFKSIIRREIREGKIQDSTFSDEKLV